MINVSTAVLKNGHKPEAIKSREKIRAHRDFYLLCDPYVSPTTLAQELKEFNGGLEHPLGPSAVSAIVQERPSKRQLIPKERTREYLIHHGRKRYNPNSDHTREQQVKIVAREMRTPNLANCEYELSDDELFEAARAVVEGTDDHDSAEIGILMSDVEAEKVEWLWEGRIPLGKLTILDGDPGLGKSVITMDLAARVTTGRGFPNGDGDHVGDVDHLDHVGDVGGVVILSAEDGLADTIRPRLDAAGADTSRILAISTVPDREGNERTVSIPEDIATIEAAIRRVNAKLVIVDPLMAFLSGKANYDQDVRKALTPLSRMAEEYGVAVVVVRHLNKRDGGKAIYRGGSSIGIIGAARSGLVVETHPDNPDLRILATTKSNLAIKAESFTYSITTASNNTAKIAWGEATVLNADDILNPDDSKLDEAIHWLRNTLKDMPLPQKTVLEDADKEGIKGKTLYRAKDALGVKSKKDGLGGTWRWHLTQDGQGSQGAQHGQGSQGGQDTQTSWLADIAS